MREGKRQNGGEGMGENRIREAEERKQGWRRQLIKGREE